jgi:spore coat protein CotH
MKRAGECTILALLICINPLAVRAREADRDDIELLLDAIAQVESRNNSDAIGDGGHARGMYQLHRTYWREGTRILKVKWDYNLAFEAEKSRRVVRAYILHYGRGKSLMDMARIHNCGPNGYKKKDTLPYARKIDEILCKNNI